MARLLSNTVKIFYISTSNSEKIVFYFHTGQALSLFLNSAILMGARYFVFITSAFAWLLGRPDVFSYIMSYGCASSIFPLGRLGFFR